MRIYRIISFVLAICLLSGAVPQLSVRATDSEPEVVLRFLVASDTHLTENPNDTQAERLTGMFESAVSYAQTQSYKRIDAAVLVGDIVCKGNPEEYASVKAVLDTAVPEGTDVLTLMGNHEWWLYSNNGMTDMGANSYLNAIADIDCIVEKDVNWNREIKGYRFIGISPISYEDYGSDNVQWQAEQIASAVADDPTKPVFVFQHHPIKDTVMGSFGSSAALESTQMDNNYSDYHQIIHFSGHSHIPVNTPTAINQTTYTQYVTGTMATLGSDGAASYNGQLPGRDNVSQYTIVEVTEDHRVKMIPYDEYTDSRFAALSGSGDLIEYTVDVNDSDNWLYKKDTRADRGGDPWFDADAAVAVSGITHESFTVSFPQATDDYGLYGYDIVCDDGTKQLSYRIYSEWYFQPMPTSLTYEVLELEAETNYSVSVYPLDFFNNKGAPITCAVTTLVAPEEEEEIILEPEAYYNNLIPYGNAESTVSTNWAKFKNASFSTEKVHSGLYSVKMHNTGSQTMVQVNLRGVVPENKYRISMWVYTDANAVKPTIQRCIVAAVESPWKTLDTQYATVTAVAGDWTQYTFDYTAPLKTDLFQLQIYCDTANSYFYIDDLEIQRLCSHQYTTYVEETEELPEHWSCRRCGKLFVDAACTEELDVNQQPDDGAIEIDINTVTDVVTEVGYNSGNDRTYFVFQSEQTMPVTGWSAYEGGFNVLVDGQIMVAYAAGMNNANQFQMYVPGDYRSATTFTVPAGAQFSKNGQIVRFKNNFTITKENGSWVKDIPPVVPTDHGGDPQLPADALNAGVSNGQFDSTTGQNFNGDAHIANGLGVLPVSGTNDYIQYNGVTVTKGVEYTLAFYVWVTEASTDFDFNLFFFGEGSPRGNWLDFVLGSANVTSSLSDGIKTVSNGWQRVTITWTAPDSGDAVFGMKNYGSNATGMVYIDDVSVTYKTPACGHSYGEWSTTVAPTYITAGEQEKICTICGDVVTQTIPVLENPVSTYNVILGDNIGLNFVLDITETDEIAVTVNDAAVEYTAVDGKICIELAAAQMTDVVHIFINGMPLANTYSVRGYADYILGSDAYDDATKNLVNCMLVYGGAAQNYFGYNTDHLASEDIEVTAATVPNEAAGAVCAGTIKGANFYGASLLHRTKTAVCFYFDAESVEDLSFYVNGVATEAVLRNGRYCVQADHINPQNIADVITVLVEDDAGSTITVSYSPLSYIVRMSGKGDTNMKALVKALYHYYQAAVEYINH